MAEAFYFGVYWGDRKEDLEVCANRLTNFLRDLSNFGESFKQWFETGYSYDEAISNKIASEFVALRDFIDNKGRYRKDIGNEVIEDMGFRVSLWNGKRNRDGGVAVSIQCGSYGKVKHFLNNCIVRIGDNTAVLGSRLKSDLFSAILAAMVRNWEPDWGVVTSHSILEHIKEKGPRSPRPGWMIFLSKGRGDIPDIPLPSKKTEIDDIGSIVIITEDLFDSSRADHRQALKRCYKFLGKAGLLKPTPQISLCCKQ